MPNPIVHWELNATDARKAQEFYATVFGWTIDRNNPLNYGLVQTNTGRGTDGGITDMSAAPKGFAIFVEVDDLQAYLDKIVSLGGKVVTPVTTVPDMITLAVFEDPQGYVMGLVKS